MTDEAVTPATLAESVDHLASETAALRNVMTERFVPREEFDKHRRNVVLAIGAALLVVALIVVALVALGQVVESNRQVIDEVSECTQPTPPGDPDVHECYDRGQRRQAEVVGQVIDSQEANADAILEQLQVLTAQGVQP